MISKMNIQMIKELIESDFDGFDVEIRITSYDENIISILENYFYYVPNISISFEVSTKHNDHFPAHVNSYWVCSKHDDV